MSGSADRAIRSICIVGAGITGLSAAAAFARALPRVRVQLIALPPDPANLTDRFPRALPSIRDFHNLIGLSEQDLIQNGIATHRLGTRFHNWSPSRTVWTLAFGETGLPAEGVEFHQLWLEARKLGRAESFGHYALGAVLGDAGKFSHPSRVKTAATAGFDYALQVDPIQYTKCLEDRCASLNVQRSEASSFSIEQRRDGGIASLKLDNASSVAADLFIDCVGPSSPLLSLISECRDCWGMWAPQQEINIFDQQATQLHPQDSLQTNETGWRLTVPLTARSMVMTSGLPAEGSIKINQGARPKPWLHNVLALGDAAVTFVPLIPLNLSVVHHAIMRALSLLPGRDCDDLEVSEYNRRTEQEVRRLRDLTSLMFLRSAEPPKSPALPSHDALLPDSLAHTLDQFERRGRLPFYEDDIAGMQIWLAVLIGLNVLPKAITPAAMRIDMDSAISGMDRISQSMRDVAKGLPTYERYLAQLKQAQ
jgi:tryptophan 7-halogenase